MERLAKPQALHFRVKLLVEWNMGAKERANAVTVDVSHSGCMAVVGATCAAQTRPADPSGDGPQGGGRGSLAQP